MPYLCRWEQGGILREQDTYLKGMNYVLIVREHDGELRE